MLSICQCVFDADIVTEIDVGQTLSRLVDHYYWMVRSIPIESPTDLNKKPYSRKWSLSGRIRSWVTFGQTIIKFDGLWTSRLGSASIANQSWIVSLKIDFSQTKKKKCDLRQDSNLYARIFFSNIISRIFRPVAENK